MLGFKRINWTLPHIELIVCNVNGMLQQSTGILNVYFEVEFKIIGKQLEVTFTIKYVMKIINK